MTQLGWRERFRRRVETTSAVTRRTLRPLRRSGHSGGQLPLVSVIVPVYNVAAYVEQSLTSLIEQTYPNIEIVIVNDGTQDSSVEIIRRLDFRGRPVKLIHQRNRGLGAARNRGVEESVGEYLTFLDSDDVLPPRAIELLASHAERSDADIAVGAMTRFNSRRRWTSEWVGRAHVRDRVLHSVEEFPEILRNFYSCDKLFRRSFWDAEGARFREGVSYEDQPLITLLLMHAARIAVLAEPVYAYRAREDKSSISQQVHSITDLAFRIEAWDETIRALEREDQHPRGRIAWFLETAGTHLHWYLRKAATGGDDYWNLLREFLVRFDSAAPPETWPLVSPLRRLALDYLRADRPDLLDEFVRRGGYTPGEFQIDVHEGTALQRIPAELFPDREFAPDELVVPVDRLRMAHRVEQLEWQRDGNALTLILAGHAYIKGIAGGAGTPTIGLDALDASGRVLAQRGPRSEGTGDPDGPADGGQSGRARFRFELPASEVLRILDDGRGAAIFRLRVDYQGVGGVQAVAKRKSRAVPARLAPQLLRGGTKVRVGFDGHGDQLQFVAVPAPFEARDVVVDSTTLSFRLVENADLTGSAVRAINTASGKIVESPMGSGDGTVRLEFPPSEPGSGDGTWKIRVASDDGKERAIAWDGTVEARSNSGRARRSKDGNLAFLQARAPT